MNNLNCTCKGSCLTLATLASIVIGVVTAFLTITAAITVTPAFLWVLFGIAVVYLGVLLFRANSLRGLGGKGCVCTTLSALLIGILGTILASVILLAITFAATSVLGAIITGALLLFFTLTLTSTACYVKCAARCDETFLEN